MFGKRRTLAASRTALGCRIQLSFQHSSSGVELLTLTSLKQMEDAATVLRSPSHTKGRCAGGARSSAGRCSGCVGLVSKPKAPGCWAPPLSSCPFLWTILSSQYPSATAPLPLFCAPFFMEQEGVLVIEVLQIESSSPQQCCSDGAKDLGLFWDVGRVCQCPAWPYLSGLEKVFLLSPSPPGQCFPSCKSLPRACACEERCLVSKA